MIWKFAEAQIGITALYDCLQSESLNLFVALGQSCENIITS